MRMEQIVEQILIDDPESRDDDMRLYYLYCYRINPEQAVSISFAQACVSHKKLCLPSYESITRARRKIQESNQLLWGRRHYERKQRQEEYRKKYSRGNI